MSNEQKPDTQSDSDLIEEVLEQTAELENEEVEVVAGEIVEEEEVSVADLQQQLVKAEQKAIENWDKALRIQAEMENLKRRTQKDLDSAHKYGLEKFAKELLSVIDSLELGIQAATSDVPEVVKLKEGSELTIKQFETVFAKFNIEAIDPTGEVFNPEFHQAMSMLPSAEAEPNTVLNVFQKGYVLNGRLIRPAMVVVAQAPA
ncbi:MAG: molecular chaperone GrpE [Methyloprofundus sp.]|nr:MAG: molecular chaperone GrpE [Methyloprofundus sp.]